MRKPYSRWNCRSSLRGEPVKLLEVYEVDRKRDDKLLRVAAADCKLEIQGRKMRRTELGGEGLSYSTPRTPHWYRCIIYLLDESAVLGELSPWTKFERTEYLQTPFEFVKPPNLGLAGMSLQSHRIDSRAWLWIGILNCEYSGPRHEMSGRIARLWSPKPFHWSPDTRGTFSVNQSSMGQAWRKNN